MDRGQYETSAAVIIAIDEKHRLRQENRSRAYTSRWDALLEVGLPPCGKLSFRGRAHGIAKAEMVRNGYALPHCG